MIRSVDVLRRSKVSRRRVSAAAIALALSLSTVLAQDVTEPSLKAALVYNLAKFTEWPPDVLPANAPFVACVLGDTTVDQALGRAVQQRMLAGRSVSVSRMSADGPLRTCHLLYVAGVAREQGLQIAAGLRGAPVLTIIDIDGLGSPGGIAKVFVENGKMRFDIDFGLAKRSRLQLSSKLLQLASRVYDEPVAGPR